MAHRSVPGISIAAVVGGIAVAAAMAAAPPLARADEPHGVLSRTSAFGDVRALSGDGDDRDIRLFHLSLGAQWRLAPTLNGGARAALLLPDGVAPDGHRAESGAGGELHLSLTPWPDARWRPVVVGAAGLLLFLEEPFLPGGDRYEFMVSIGGGVDVSLAPRWVLRLRVLRSHLSNGQGIGPHNPAYDGVGYSLGVERSLSERRSLPTPWEAPAGCAGREEWRPGGVLDATGGAVDGEWLATARLRVAQRLARHLIAVLDMESGVLSSDPLNELGLAVAAHRAWVSAALYGGHRWFSALKTPFIGLQLEGHVTPELSIVAQAGWERPELRGTIWRGTFAARAFPVPSLAIEGGLGVESDNGSPSSSPYFAAEWLLPWRTDDWQVGLFVEHQADGLTRFGARLRYDVGPTLRDSARGRSLRRMR